MTLPWPGTGEDWVASASIQPFPRTVRLIPDETVTSFIARLAEANQLADRQLRRHLSPRHDATTKTAKTALTSLAQASGYSPRVLCYALPELRSQYPARHNLHLHYRTRGARPNEIRPACRRCMAAKGIYRQVEIWMRHDQNVCLRRRHRLWIGPGVSRTREQIDLIRVPEIVQAQRRHNALLRENNRQWAQQIYEEAALMNRRWDGSGHYRDLARQRYHTLAATVRHRYNPAYHASLYPDTIALAGILISPYWHRLMISDDITDRERFYLEIRRRVFPDYVPANRMHDHLVRWVNDYRKQHDLASLLEMMFSTHETAETT